MAEITKDEVVKFIENMTVLELSELVKELEERFGVSAAAPLAMAAMPGSSAPRVSTGRLDRVSFSGCRFLALTRRR